MYIINKAVVGILLFLIFVVPGLFAEIVNNVHYFGGTTMPASYDLIVSKSDSLLHYYKAYTNTDSVWINTFTSNKQGQFSAETTVYAYQIADTVSTVPNIILFEYSYSKLFLHFKVEELLLVGVVNDNNQTEMHIIDLTNYYINPSEFGVTYYLMFQENTIFFCGGGSINKIDLNTNQISTIYSIAYSRFSILCDDYLICQAGYESQGIFLDSTLSIFPGTNDLISSINNFSTKAVQLNNLGYLVRYSTLIMSDCYGYFFVENNQLLFNYLSVGFDEFPVFYDDFIIPLAGAKYLSINIIKRAGIELDRYFGKYEIINVEKVYLEEFPNIYQFPHPRSLTRINDQFVVGCSGVEGDSMNFHLIDLANQKLDTFTFSLDENPLDWTVYTIGQYFYLANGNRLHSFEITSTVGNEDEVNEADNLMISNFPNPFNPETTLLFSIPQDGQVCLEIFNVKGQKVVNLVNSRMEKGNHKVAWSGKDSNNNSISSGVYFSKLTSGGKTQVKKMLLMK